MRISSWICIGVLAAGSAAALRPSGTQQRVAAAVAPAGKTLEVTTTAAHSSEPRPIDPRPHLVALPLTAAGRPRARNAGIERALEQDDADPVWTRAVDAEARERLAGDPALHIDALQCTHTFCRIQMSKPVDSAMDWEAVDQALTPIARGETIFAAEHDGAQTTGYLYFAAVGSILPVEQLHESADRRTAWSP